MRCRCGFQKGVFVARFAVTRRGISGPGSGGEYTYYASADSAAVAVERVAAKAGRWHHRLNRGGTDLDPKPIRISRIN